MHAFNFGCGRGLKCFPVAGKFNRKRGALPRGTSNTDVAAVITYDRLHDRKPKASSMVLAGVIRSEDALALFRRQARTSILDFKEHSPILTPGSKSKRAAVRHRIHRVQNQI